MEFLDFDNDYQLAWAIYLLAGLGCFWMWTFFTRWMWRYLREPLWVIAVALLFTPVQISSQEQLMVPASFLLGLELVFKQNKDSWLALTNLAVVLVTLLVVYLLFALSRWFLLRQSKEQTKQTQETEQEAQAS